MIRTERERESGIDPINLSSPQHPWKRSRLNPSLIVLHSSQDIVRIVICTPDKVSAHSRSYWAEHHHHHHGGVSTRWRATRNSMMFANIDSSARAGYPAALELSSYQPDYVFCPLCQYLTTNCVMIRIHVSWFMYVVPVAGVRHLIHRVSLAATTPPTPLSLLLLRCCEING